MKPILATSAPFPFLGHRTIAEVDETRDLMTMSSAQGLDHEETRRLKWLLRLAKAAKCLPDGRAA